MKDVLSSATLGSTTRLVELDGIAFLKNDAVLETMIYSYVQCVVLQ